MDKNYTRTDISKDTIEIEITIPKDIFKKSYDILLEQESKKVDVKGFRKGSTPKELIEGKLQDGLLLETFEKIGPLYVSKAVQEENLEIVAPPVYKEFPKLKEEKDLVFKVHITVMPEFKLGDMKKIKVTVANTEVTDEEVEATIENITKSQKVEGKKGSKEWVSNLAKLLDMKDVETKEDLYKFIKDILSAQKENNVRKGAENEALRKGIELSKILIPQPAIDYESHEREHSFEHSLEEKRLTIEQFTKSNGITLEKMREMWKIDAKEALETDVFLNTYAQAKDIKVEDEELKTEIEKIKTQNPQQQFEYDNPQWQEYIRRVVRKQKAYNDFISSVLPTKMNTEVKK